MRVTSRCEQCGAQARYVPAADGGEWVCDKCGLRWPLLEQRLFGGEGTELAELLWEDRDAVWQAAQTYLAGPATPTVVSSTVAALRAKHMGDAGLQWFSSCVIFAFGGLMLLAAVAATIVLSMDWSAQLDLDSGFLAFVLWGLAVGPAAWRAWELVKRRKRRHRTREVLRDVFRRRNQPEDVGALLLAAAEDDYQGFAVDRLTHLAPRVTPEHGAALSGEEALAAAQLLESGLVFRFRPNVDWTVPRLCVSLLGETACPDAPRVLALFTDRDIWWPGQAPVDVKAVAATALERVKRRLAEKRESKQLLRASGDPEVDPNSLLRSAGSGEEPQGQLLRRANGDSATDGGEAQ